MSDIWSLLEVVLHVTKCAFLLHGQFDCQVEGLSWDVARATDCWSPHDSFWPQMCLALLLSSYKAIDYMTWISSRKWQEESWSTGFHTLWVFLRPCRITRLIYVGLVIPGLTFELLDTQPCLDHLNTSASKALWRLDLKTQVSQMSVPQLISLTGKQIQKKKFIALQHSGKALRIVTLHSSWRTCFHGEFAGLCQLQQIRQRMSEQWHQAHCGVKRQVCDKVRRRQAWQTASCPRQLVPGHTVRFWPCAW